MSVTYIDAIHDAQKDLLTEDRDVFLYGQDIGVFGGAFKATKGLKELFPDRVIDAPISEDAMAGMVTGAAVMGKKPIMEVQFADFSTIAFNQIVNMAATHYYRTGIPANITVRLPCGGTPGTGPFHSQSLEALFAHYPGLHVMTPATVADAYWMLRQAVEIPDPVIFLEHKFLYMDTVIASVARTGRVLVVGEDFPWGGVTAEVVSRIVAEGFHLLDAPPQRLNARDTPIPQHPNLWKAHRPTLESIAASIRHLLSI